MRFMKNIKMIALLLIICLTFTECSSNNASPNDSQYNFGGYIDVLQQAIIEKKLLYQHTKKKPPYKKTLTNS